MRQGILSKYGHRLKVDQKFPLSLGEGNTPLIPAPRLAEVLAPGAELYLKYEGLNPTGSFKDRGMVTAITQSLAEGAKAVICASTGNTAASAAAYAARAGLKCFVLIPDGKVALGKLAGAIAYGAQVIQIRGSFDEGLDLVRKVGEETPLAVVNSINPYRLEGQQTGAWEICEALGGAPDWMTLPVGNAGNISAYWMGYTACDGCKCAKKPRLLGVQAAGAAPLVLGHKVEKPETKATAIRIGNPARGDQALRAIQESNGHILSATDEQIFEAYHLAAKLEGVFCEPSSAAGLAGLKLAVANGTFQVEGKRIVAILTGHGLKDPDSALGEAPSLQTIDPSFDVLRSVLDGKA